MKLIIGLVLILVVAVTIKPFESLIFDTVAPESAPIKAQVLKEEVAPEKEQSKPDEAPPEPIEENMTEMGLAMGFGGEGAAISGVGGGGGLSTQSAVVKPAKVLKRAEPIYPPRAKAAQITGSVTLKIHISESGDVLHCLVMSSDPSGVFEESAISAVEKWRFEPAVKNGQRVSSYIVQKVSFRMEN